MWLIKFRGTSARMKIFPTKAKAVLFAGVLGYHLGKTNDVESFGEGIRLEYFDEDVKMIDIIAIAAKEELAVVSDERRKELIETFELYVKTGLEHIRDICFSGQRTPLEGMFLILSSPPGGNKEALPGLI